MFTFKIKVKIMVVDDEPVILKIVKRILEKKGYVVTTFESPVTALEELKKTEVDLVLTDLKMPEMDGIQFLHQVKKIKPSIPVIMITAYATIETAVTAMQWGAFDYIKKPFEIDQLYDVVERAITFSERGIAKDKK